MRIQEVIRQTGLSRRTIYYYIDQKLITPKADEANGYHDFSEKDVQKLFLIRKLREAGLPLADIQAIFCNGGTSYTSYNKYCRAMTGREAVKLPSTSPANARWTKEMLLHAWREAICPYLTIV